MRDLEFHEYLYHCSTKVAFTKQAVLSGKLSALWLYSVEK